MRTYVGSIPVEVVRAESARFLRPLLLLHGLWTGGWIWQPLAGYLAHRGWESWAPSLLEGEPSWSDHEAMVVSLAAVARALPAPPIIIAHDVGVVAGTILASMVDAPAVIAVAPVVPPVDAGGSRGVFGWPRFWSARLRRTWVHPPRSRRARSLFGPRERLRPEPGTIFHALATSRARLPERTSARGLIVSGGRDGLSPPRLMERLAARFSWDRQVYPDRGHPLLLEPGWEAVADDLHRWIVRTMGAELLAFIDEDDS
jgi:pimeloyl-ACP methyl ester carboxylesterase